MNVTLTIPADAGTERASTTLRRGNGADADAGNFRALYDQVAQATAAERRPQSDSPSAPTDTPEDGEADAAPRRADGRHDGDQMTQDATQDGVSDKPSDSRAVPHQRMDKDAADDPVNRRDAGQSDRKDDSAASPADASAAVPTGAAVALSLAQVNGAGLLRPDAVSAAGSIDHGKVGRAVRPEYDGAAVGEPGKDAAAEASAKRARGDAQTDSGRVRLWARGDSAAAFAASDKRSPWAANRHCGEGATER